MSSCLTLDSLSLVTPEGDTLFDNLTLSLGREAVGLVGRNGCGKSTLLKAVAGDLAPARGQIGVHGRAAMLQQHFDEAETVAEALGVDADLARLARITAGNGTAQDFDAADWTLEARLEKALADTGLADVDTARKIGAFSGGERTRIGLARLLLAEPDLILLDEPTNNLDAEGRASVMSLIENWSGGLLIASHDRALLERMDRIVELTPVGCTVFGGGWSEFKAARDAARARAKAEATSAANRLKATERKTQQAKERQDRSDARGRAVRARGDQPKLVLDARAQRAEATSGRGNMLASRQLGEAQAALSDADAQLERITPLTIELPTCNLPASRQLLSVQHAEMRFGERQLFGPLSFEVRGPQRLAIKGPNGSGKSTLLKLITGELAPTSGTISPYTDRTALLDQHSSSLDPNSSLIENMRRLAPALSENEARAQLARFAFRAGDALQLAGTLSGGERLRAALAAAFAAPHPPELLLLDEPTNHLDMEAVSLLEAALQSYDGAILAISHDERFLEAIRIEHNITLGRSISK
ncbi:ABC-F family ATP-binding cassette domain-containing protein [Henriciella sp.]|uniref:ABC-F family ATP-binding cassette domain-containing protein n=1 Tax=Henriciella sp. TaxID=1968823 RepID=UPI001792F6C4|nr:ABC-F family ATP-binding cassette domain-containing protein [Henriciella sp.]HIG22915.1 ABC-F family ATP-binding cassette domain-containing protein [Henriciella sp.]